MAKDILGNKLQNGEIAVFAKINNLKVGKVSVSPNSRFYFIEKYRGLVSSDTSSQLALLLTPFIIDPLPEIPVNPHANRVDILGTPLGLGQTIAYVRHLRNGYKLDIAKIVEVGPKGGLRIRRMRKYNKQLVVIKSSTLSYFNTALVLNGNLGERIMRFKLKVG